MGIQVEVTCGESAVEITTDADWNPLAMDDITRTARRNLTALIADLSDEPETPQLSHRDAMRKDFLLDDD